MGCRETVEKVAQPLFRGGLHESFVSISCEIVGEAFVRSVISEVHTPGNDIIQFYSVAISALSAAALRRLRSETRLRAQFWRRNSLQEGFFDKLRRAGPVGPALRRLRCCQQFYVTPVCWERKTLIRYFYNKPSSFILYS